MDPRWTPTPHVQRFTAPAAGANFTFRARNAAGWLFRTLRFQLNTDANVATRELFVSVSDGTDEWIRVGAQTSQTAGIQREYCGVEGIVAGASTLPIRTVDWPRTGIYVPNGHTLTLGVNAIQVGDTLVNIAGYVVEFPIGPKVSLWPLPSFYTEESE